MPIYEYKCQSPSCGLIEEKIQPVGSPWVDECSRCGHTSGRIISSFAFDIPGFKNGQDITVDGD